MTRFRLPAETIRDQALFTSSLLVEKIGGPSVKPYQPAGLWSDLSFQSKIRTTDYYIQDTGEDLYRRSLYTFWRRIVAPTMFFDSASRQTCTVKAQRTNTPLHALSTFNDVTYAEAARAMAERVFREAGKGASDEAWLNRALKIVLARDASEAEMAIWKRGLDRAREDFKQDRAAAEALLAVGESSRDNAIDPIEHAALATVCLTILNSDEALNRE